MACFTGPLFRFLKERFHSESGLFFDAPFGFDAASRHLRRKPISPSPAISVANSPATRPRSSWPILVCAI